MSSYEVEQNFHKGFTKDFGRSLLATAMAIAPYDTGNLVDSIRLSKNSWQSVQIKYPIQDAFYTPIVEFGGAVVTPKTLENIGFIRFKTVSSFINIITNYFENDYLPFMGKERFSQAGFFFDMTQQKGFNPFSNLMGLRDGDVDMFKYRVGLSRYKINGVRQTRQLRRDLSRFYYSRSLGSGGELKRGE